MRRAAGSALAMGVAVSKPAGGIVTFDPPVIRPWAGDTMVNLEVSVSPEVIDTFAAVDMLLGSDTFPLSSFVYGPDFEEAADPFIATPVPLGRYPHDLYVGGFFATGPVSAIRVGTLTVELAESLPAGRHGAMVDPIRDGRSSSLALGEQTKPLWGSVYIIPEPMTLALVGLGAVGLVCGRKRSKPRHTRAEHPKRRAHGGMDSARGIRGASSSE